MRTCLKRPKAGGTAQQGRSGAIPHLACTDPVFQPSSSKRKLGLHFICSPLTGVLGSFPGPCCKRAGPASFLFGTHLRLAPVRSHGCLTGKEWKRFIKFHSNHFESGSSTQTPVVQGWAAQLVCDGKGPTFLLEASGAFLPCSS